MSEARIKAPATTPESVFLEQRPRLLGLAYRMLGSAADAEDVVQEAYLRWHQAGSVDNPAGFLTALVTRLCIDRYRRERLRRRHYPGPWLPEPLPSGADAAREAEHDDTLRIGVLRLMETLGPLERAVFVLAEAFDYRAREIAALIERSEPHCRQLLRRARGRLAQRHRRETVSPAERDRFLAEFLHAARDGNQERLKRLLREDVALVSDGGGKVAAASRPIGGRRAVSRFLLGVRRLAAGRRIDIRLTALNGAPAALVHFDGTLETAFILELSSRGIAEIYALRNPDKLARLILHLGSGDQSPDAGP